MANTSVQVGPGLLGMLGIAFVVLKLTDVIAWSWWWVTAPFWIPFAVLAGLALLAGVVFLIGFCYQAWKERRNSR